MTIRNGIELTVLGAVWGASFIFMRIASPELGPLAMTWLRVAMAALFLLPVLAASNGIADLRKHWRPLLIVGAVNTVIPFSLNGYSTLHLAGGFVAIINATSPLWGALVAWLWLSERLRLSQAAGLAIGFAGVVVLVSDRLGEGLDGALLGIGASLVASLMYGIAANYARRYLIDVRPLAVAAGSQFAATLILTPFAIVAWPAGPVSTETWVAVSVMGVVSTGFAYLLYFRVLASAGTSTALTVTYLIPAFAVLWGALLIGEVLTLRMAVGCAVILAGTALATGLIGRRRTIAAGGGREL